MGKTIRLKYDPSLKVKVVTEYFQGASAKELYAKYGVKQRTIYEWSKKAKQGMLVSSSEKSGMDFLNSNVANDNDDVNDNNELKKKVVDLEDKVKKLEYALSKCVGIKIQ